MFGKTGKIRNSVVLKTISEHMLIAQRALVSALALLAICMSCYGQSNWSSSTNYSVSALVIGSDTNIYRAVAAGAGHDPTIDSGAFWHLNNVCVLTTLSVGSGERFSSVTQAYDFVADAEILHAYYTVISIDAGYVSPEPAPITIDTPYGHRLQIIGGNGSELQFGTFTSGITIGSGCSLGYLSGVTLVGPSLTPSNYSTFAGSSGIIVNQGADLVLGPQVSVDGWDNGVNVNAGTLSGPNAGELSISGAGDRGLLCQNGAKAIVPYVQVTNVSDLSAHAGFGIAATMGSSISCPNASVTSARIAYYAQLASSINAVGATCGGITDAESTPPAVSNPDAAPGNEGSYVFVAESGSGGQGAAIRPASAMRKSPADLVRLFMYEIESMFL